MAAVGLVHLLSREWLAGLAAFRVPTPQLWRRALDTAFSSQSASTAQSCDAAAKLYEDELKRTGYADAELLLKAADAVNTAMRIRTNSNTITIDGTVETPANKAVWKKNGQRAYDLAAKGLKASSKVDSRALGIRFDLSLIHI